MGRQPDLRNKNQPRARNATRLVLFNSPYAVLRDLSRKMGDMNVAVALPKKHRDDMAGGARENKNTLAMTMAG